ncbi:MAG: hypothetical protein RBG1_1C00001G1710 [candidate division Zixibacteria bacterium RBG-1]|nr:MAG: hypothetical protein RBG1_1C00001G1710 [candidate division Zixibacteria bacterium RBG-1]OGC86081.1 MAG: hypothetical protein A2V73_06625 [candidate division Zixibacteria bacterium RBG_19FT_COMBO_42_43]
MKDSLETPAKNFTRMDYYQMALSILMVILGPVIIVRSLLSGFSILALIVGIGFLFLGAYRLSFVYRFLKGQKR